MNHWMISIGGRGYGKTYKQLIRERIDMIEKLEKSPTSFSFPDISIDEVTDKLNEIIDKVNEIETKLTRKVN